MIEQLKSPYRNVVAFKLTGRLHDEDYKHFIPVMEEAIKAAGPLRLLAVLEDFHGWDLKALWDDTRFGALHFRDFERIALVGEKAWEHWMAEICKVATKAKVEYFPVRELQEAWAWISEGLIPTTPPTTGTDTAVGAGI